MADFSKLTVDNITYNVKDKTARDTDNYYTNETIIGKSVNNKPIYRKVITNFVTNGGQHNIGNVDNIDELINFYGGYSKAGDNKIPINFYIDNSFYLRTWIWNNDVYYDCVGYNGYNGTIIIEYTKTTD